MSEENVSYQEPAITGAAAEQNKLNEMGTQVTTTPEQFAAQEERTKFESYVQDQGVVIPQNYKSAGDWFDSLKEAQGQYTQARQEIAELKQSYNEQGTENPNYQEPVATPEPAVAMPGNEEELRINITPEKEDAPPSQTNITPELWAQWGPELAVTGDLSSETITGIKETTGFSDSIINEYVSGQKARMRESYSDAAGVVGGKDKLNQIFKWAETSLSTEEQANINMGLASSTYEVTLRGLESMFDKRPIGAEKAQEPRAVANTAQVGSTDTGYTGYTTQREFTADRNNPRFKLEPAYRQAVEHRMMLTDFNSLPA